MTEAMKFKFKIQPYQTNAVESVVDCFAGQLPNSGLRYRIDPGVLPADHEGMRQVTSMDDQGFRNPDIQLTSSQLIANIQEVQKR